MSSEELSAKTVQEYIDEKPCWPNGTTAPQTPMTLMQWQIWGLASAGKFFEGLVVFMTGVALPLIAMEFHLNAAQKGMVGSASIFGILIGATVLGSLADHFGRKQLFIAEMIIFLVFLIAMTLSPNFPLLLVFLFGMGLALGCDYPTAHLVISECLPSNNRGRLVLSAFAFQAVGVLVGTAIGYIILRVNKDISDWRLMYAVAIIPTIFVVVGRFFVAQSPQWLMSHGRVEEAQKEVLRLLNRTPKYPTNVVLKEVPNDEPVHERHKSKFKKLFNAKNRRATILASVPWFLQDLGTYGIGIFTPTILSSILGHTDLEEQNLAGVIHNDMIAAKGAAFLDFLLLVGIIAAVLLADKVGRIKLQILGFFGCAAGLVLAAFSTHMMPGDGQTALLFAGFMVFNFMTNLGPNAMTYLIAGEVFPTEIRGSGAGFAASIAKIGAVVTAFLFPMLLSDIGINTVLYSLVGACILGAFITWQFRIETMGVNLETIGRSKTTSHDSQALLNEPAAATMAWGGLQADRT
jgi:MFS transporter, putative metabolite transport protein